MPHVIIAPMSTVIRRMLDRVGATGSLVCAVHCALMPLLLALAPLVGWTLFVGLEHNHDLEQAFVLFVTLLGLFSLVWGYRRHRAFRALGMLLAGLAVLWLGLLYPPLHDSAVAHAVTMTLGGTLVGLAHLVNLRLNHGHVHDATCSH